jgi:hypothetical protein
MLLAASGFIPGLGVLTGAAAASWGLVSSRPRAMLAAAIGAAGALLNIGGFALLTSSMQDDPSMQVAQTAMVAGDLVKVVRALESHHERHGAYPAQLEALVGSPIPRRLINVNDNSTGLFALPRPYQYRRAPDGRSYDLFAVGRDGEPGTDDDIRPLLTDSLRFASGYRPAR